MAVIPHEAHQLSVHISTPLALHIAIRERKQDRHILQLSKHHSRRFEVEQDNYLRYDPSVPQNLQIIEVDSNVIGGLILRFCHVWLQSDIRRLQNSRLRQFLLMRLNNFCFTTLHC